MNWTPMLAMAVGAGFFALRLSGAVEIRPGEYEIVAGMEESKAATELQAHLELIGGERIPVVAKRTGGKKTFSFAPLPVAANPEAAEWTVDKNGVVFRGHPYFAVVDFLENGLGVRWPESDLASYVPTNPIPLRTTSGRWTAELSVRDIRTVGGEKRWTDPGNETFRDRMRMSRARRPDAPLYGHAFTQMWKRFGKTHPEYFAMREDGLRGPWCAKKDDLEANVAAVMAQSGQVAMCCTSTGLVGQIVRDWMAAGAQRYINLCENDVEGRFSCKCAACRALDVVPENLNLRWQTHLADRYVYFANKVLEAARKVRPDVNVCYYAYNATQDAPRRQRVDPATVIGLVPTYFTKDYISDYIESWKAVGAVRFFYRPNRHHYYRCAFIPVGYEKHFFDLFQYIRAAGAFGFDYDANAMEKCGYGWFERYVLYHAMQDPSKPFSHWENHYCEAFGAAAEDVKSYLRYWREAVWDARIAPRQKQVVEQGRWFNFANGLHKNVKEYYSLADYAAAERFLRSAEARELLPPHRALVRRIRDRHDHAVLYFKALTERSRANSAALSAFRKAHGMNRNYWFERYYGDLVGMKEFFGLDGDTMD